jgi:hypothetical protein
VHLFRRLEITVLIEVGNIVQGIVDLINLHLHFDELIAFFIEHVSHAIFLDKRIHFGLKAVIYVV